MAIHFFAIFEEYDRSVYIIGKIKEEEIDTSVKNPYVLT